MNLNSLLRKRFNQKVEADFLITIFIFLPGGGICRYEFIRVQDDYLCIVVKKKTVLRDIEKKRFLKIFNTLHSMKVIPVLKREQETSTETTVYTVTIESGENTIQFHWYDTCPREWKPVSKVVEKLVRLAENAG
ncbi:MAG TPA: hypothetical protein PKK43_06520 [Spirochaetota bacterium]|nr:hypothetical protein [Spirochaetota bacterium]